MCILYTVLDSKVVKCRLEFRSATHSIGPLRYWHSKRMIVGPRQGTIEQVLRDRFATA